MPVRADLGIGPFDVVEGQNLIGIFSFIRLEGHKRMIHKEKKFWKKKNFKKIGPKTWEQVIYTQIGVGVGWRTPRRERELTARGASVEQSRRAWNISTAPPSPEGVPR